MAIQVLTNAKLWIAGYDFTGDVNALALKYGAEMKDKTNFGSGGFRERIPGVKSFSFQHEGFVTFGAGNVDEQIFSNFFAVKNIVTSIDPKGGGAEGDVCFTGQVETSQYMPGAKHGEVLAFSVSGESDGDELVRGTLMANRYVTANGNGPVVQLGAVAAAQKVYGGLHFLANITGSGTPRCNVTVESAPAANFASATTRLTFTSATAAGAEWQNANGAITDTWWRVKYVLTGSSPSFPIVATVGIK